MRSAYPLPPPSSLQQWPASDGAAAGSNEAVLDFILSTLITPRTVSAIVHAAKKLVCSNVMAMGPVGSTGGTVPLPPDIEVQHGIALLTTALRAIDTCLQAAAYLSNPAALTAVSGGGGGGGGIAGGQLLPLAATEEDAGIIMNDYGDSAATAAGAVVTPRQLSASASAVAQPPLPSMAARTTAPAATPTGHSNTMLVRTATTRYSSRSSSFNTVATTVGTAYATAGTGNAYAPSLGRTSPSRSEAAAPSEPSEMTSNHSLGGGPWHPQPHPGAPPPSAADINMAASISVLPSTADPTSPTSVATTDSAPAALFPAAGGGIHAGLAAAMGQSQGVSLFTSHWSAHLHSLIAQLHWDIGVQRHRRRRQHAAAQVRPERAVQGGSSEGCALARGESGEGEAAHICTGCMQMCLPECR